MLLFSLDVGEFEALEMQLQLNILDPKSRVFEWACAKFGPPA